MGMFWFRSRRLDVPKEEKMQKRDKWTEFIDENK